MLKLKQQINKKRNKLVALQSCQTFSTHQHQSTSTTSSTSINHNNNNITKHSKSKRIKPIKLSLSNNQNRTLDQLLQSIHLSTPIIPTTLIGTTATKSTSTKTKSTLRTTTKSKSIHSHHHSLHLKQQHNRHQPQYQQQFNSSKFTKRQSIFSSTKLSSPSTTTSFRTFSASNHDSAFPTSFQDSITSLSSSPSTFSSLTKSAAFLRLSIVDVDIFLSNDKIPNHDLILPLLVSELQSIADEVPKVNYSTTTTTTTETNPLNNVATLILKHYTDITGNYKRLIEQAQFSHDKAISTLRLIYPNSDPELKDAITKIATGDSSSNGKIQLKGSVDTIQKALQYVLDTDVQLTFDMMKDDIRGMLTYLHTIYNDPGFKDPFYHTLPYFVEDYLQSEPDVDYNETYESSAENDGTTDEQVRNGDNTPVSTDELTVSDVEDENIVEDIVGEDEDIEHPADQYLPLIDSYLGQQPMYISKLLHPIALTGRSTGKRPQGKYSFTIPQPRTFKPLQQTEIFFTPQQSILFFGTLSETFIALEIKSVEEETQSSESLRHFASIDLSTYTDPIILNQVPNHEDLQLKFNALEQSLHVEQLAKDLEMDKIELIDILLTCSTLMFRFQTPGLRKDGNVVVAPHGEGKSTLYLLLLNTLDHLNVPVGYMASEWVIEPPQRRPTTNKKKQKNETKKSPGDQNRYLGFYSNGANGFNVFETDSTLPPQPCKNIRGLVLFTDCADGFYNFDNWSALRTPYADALHNISVLFTFSSAGKQLSTPCDKTQVFTLADYGIFPFIFTPTVTNYLKGTIQLQFYRQFASLLHHPSTITSLLQSSIPPQDEQKLSKYFGDKLYQLVTKYQNDFIQYISPLQITNQSISPSSPLSIENDATKTATTITTTPPKQSVPNTTATSTSSLQPNTTTTTTPTTSLPIKPNNYQLLTQFINDPKHYPLYSEIITNPILKALTYKQTALFANYNISSKTDAFSIFLSSLQDPHHIAQQPNTKLSGPKQTQFKKNAILVPSALLVKKDGPIVPTMVDPNAIQINFNTILPNQQEWYKFHQLLQSSSSSSSSSTRLISPSSLSLFKTIHELWYDLSLLQTHLIPNTRHFSFLTRNVGTKRIKIRYSAEALSPTFEPTSNKKNQLPTLKLTAIPPKVAPFFTEFQHINVLQQYHSYIYPTGIPKTKATRVYNKSAVGFEHYFIDSLLQWIDKHPVHLPFQGFHFNPIENIRSYNNFHGIQLQATPRPNFQFVPLPNASREYFVDELSLLVTKQEESYFIVCPSAFPCVDFIYVQRHNNKTQLLCLQLSAGVQPDDHKNDILEDLLNNTKFPVDDVAYTYITNQFLPILPQMDLPFYAIDRDASFINESELSVTVKRIKSGIIYLKKDGHLIDNSESAQIQARSLDSMHKQGPTRIDKSKNLNLFLGTSAQDLLQLFQKSPYRVTFRLNEPNEELIDHKNTYDQIYKTFPRIQKEIEAFRSGKQTVFDIKTDGSKDENDCYSYKIHLRFQPKVKTDKNDSQPKKQVKQKAPRLWDWEHVLGVDQKKQTINPPTRTKM